MLDALLSPAAAELYERLVDGEPVLVVDGTGLDPTLDGTPAHELVQRNLASSLPVDAGALLSVEPLVGVRSGLRSMWQDIRSGLDLIQATLRDAETLQTRYLSARLHVQDEKTAVILTDTNWIAARHTAMTDTASNEIMAFVTNTWLRDEPPALLTPSEDQRSRGVLARTVFASDFLPEHAALIAGSIAGGEVIRVARELPIKMKIVDRREAIVGLDETALRAALYIREPAFIAALCLFFELVWESAIPYERNDEVVTPREREVLVLLATGYKDEAIAKKLNVGVRTVRRHISIAMQKLGTESRFAAGVQAVKRGWL